MLGVSVSYDKSFSATARGANCHLPFIAYFQVDHPRAFEIETKLAGLTKPSVWPLDFKDLGEWLSD
jgi:hypothetical protein